MNASSKSKQQIFNRRAVLLSAWLGFWGVGTGAFGAHALKNVLSEYEKGIWQTAILYLFVHVLVMIAVIFLPSLLSGNIKYVRLAFGCFASGSIVFAGSLQLLAVTGVTWLGAVTPIGGLLLIAGWVLLFVYALSIKLES